MEATALAATVAAVAYALRTLRDRRTPPPVDGGDMTIATGPRGLQVGDVLLHGSEEAWLSGMLEGHEDGAWALRLFKAPGARASWVAQLDVHAERIAYLSEHEVPLGRVPAELTIGGLRYHLEKRCSIAFRRSGEDVPHETTADYICLSATAGRIILVFDFEDSRLSLAGEVMPRSMLELLPGDYST